MATDTAGGCSMREKQTSPEHKPIYSNTVYLNRESFLLPVSASLDVEYGYRYGGRVLCEGSSIRQNISLSSMCDGFIDCINGFDESHCGKCKV